MGEWEASDVIAPERAALVRAVLAFKDRLDPWLPFPQYCCCFAFGPEARPLPLGALYLLWEHWPAITGPCPECGGPGYGYGFAGFLAMGWIAGACTACDRSLTGHTGGQGQVAQEIGPILRGTPFSLGRSAFGGAYEGRRRPLVDALRELGATGIPDEAWADERDPCGVSFSISTEQGPVNLAMEVDAEPVPYGSNGTGRMLYPMRQIQVSGPGRGKKPTKGGRSRWQWLWLPIALSLYLGARSLLGGGDWQDAGSNGGYPNGIQFQVPAAPMPTFPAGFWDSLIATPSPDPPAAVTKVTPTPEEEPPPPESPGE